MIDNNSTTNYISPVILIPAPCPDPLEIDTHIYNIQKPSSMTHTRSADSIDSRIDILHKSRPSSVSKYLSSNRKYDHLRSKTKAAVQNATVQNLTNLSKVTATRLDSLNHGSNSTEIRKSLPIVSRMPIGRKGGPVNAKDSVNTIVKYILKNPFKIQFHPTILRLDDTGGSNRKATISNAKTGNEASNKDTPTETSLAMARNDQRTHLIEESKYPEGYKNPFDYSMYARSLQISKRGGVPVDEETPKKLKTFRCLICYRMEDTKESLLDHYEYHKREKDKLEGQNLPPKFFECPVCSKAFHLWDSYEKHINDVHGEKEFFCNICKRNYINAYTLSVHNTLHSQDPDVYTCSICKQFTCKSTLFLQRHINTNHKNELYECDVCEKVFTSLSRLNNHKVFHTNTTGFCPICEKQFSNCRNLESHNRKFHSGGILSSSKHECSTCNVSFATRKAMMKHMSRHGSSECLCSVCGKKFKTQRSLNLHMVLHSGEKKYMCSVCGKSFYKNDVLVGHMRTHSGEKPYKCETCGKCFSQRSPLVIHQRSHTGDKPYICQNCSRGFVSRNALNIHSRRCK